MELLLLKAYGKGYRGCAVDEDGYLFFQCTPRRGVQQLKRYPKADFSDIEHFMAMMQKFISPPSFLQPPVPIEALNMESLDRAYANIPS